MPVPVLAMLLLQAAPPPPPPACGSAEQRQFDFWVGEWQVTPNQDGAKPIANSRIERLYGDCAIRENWMPLKGGGGGSLNSYDAADGRWHQHWIDSSGQAADFDGGLVGNEMVLTGWWKNSVGAGKHALVRMRYSKRPDGSVRQHGEQSVDQGLTWATSFDLIYRPLKPQ